LPTLAEEIELKRSAVDEELRRLPESFAENPQVKLLSLFDEFNTCIKETTTGNESRPEFFEGLHKEFARLSTDITNTCPKFDILSTNTRINRSKKNTLSKGSDWDSRSSDFVASRESLEDNDSEYETELDGEAIAKPNKSSRLFILRLTKE
jgi:hypothetical protein